MKAVCKIKINAKIQEIPGENDSWLVKLSAARYFYFTNLDLLSFQL